MFKIGDKVKWAGVEGVVSGIIEDGNYPIWVSFENCRGGGIAFKQDGKLLDWHKEPSLVLVERAAQFEEVVGYSVVCKLISTDVVIVPAIYATKEDALKHNDNAIGYQEVKYFRKVE